MELHSHNPQPLLYGEEPKHESVNDTDEEALMKLIE